MLKSLAKIVAKWVIGYLPDIAVWAIEQANNKTKDSEKAKSVLAVIKQVSNDANMLASAMEDGNISDNEKQAIKTRANALVEDIKELL